MDRVSKQSSLGAHLRRVSGVGAPGQLGDAEAKHGDNVDVDAPIPEGSNCPVHSICMLRGHIWGHLQSKFWRLQAGWAMCSGQLLSSDAQKLQHILIHLHLECPKHLKLSISATSQVYTAAVGYGFDARPC